MYEKGRKKRKSVIKEGKKEGKEEKKNASVPNLARFQSPLRIKKKNLKTFLKKCQIGQDLVHSRYFFSFPPIFKAEMYLFLPFYFLREEMKIIKL